MFSRIASRIPKVSIASKLPKHAHIPKIRNIRSMSSIPEVSKYKYSNLKQYLNKYAVERSTKETTQLYKRTMFVFNTFIYALVAKLCVIYYGYVYSKMNKASSYKTPFYETASNLRIRVTLPLLKVAVETLSLPDGISNSTETPTIS